MIVEYRVRLVLRVVDDRLRWIGEEEVHLSIRRTHTVNRELSWVFLVSVHVMRSIPFEVQVKEHRLPEETVTASCCYGELHFLPTITDPTVVRTQTVEALDPK